MGEGRSRIAGPRLIALVGPFQSGKTTLLESILARAGALARQGTVQDASTTVSYTHLDVYKRQRPFRSLAMPSLPGCGAATRLITRP